MKTSSLRAALSGVLAGGVALAVGELIAGIGNSQRAPVIAVGDMVIKAVGGFASKAPHYSPARCPIR